MKNCIFLVLFTLFIISPVLCAEQQNNNPTLVFYVDHQTEQKKDFVEITLEIQAKDTSLITAINTGASTVQKISQMADKKYCKRASGCTDAGKFEIQPRYQLIRKQPVFMGFTVTHEMTIIVKSSANIGQLVDNILTKSGVTLKKFEWKAEKEPKTHEQAIAEGMEQAEGLCAQLGLKLGRVISIEQVNEEEGAQQQQQQQEQQEQQEGEQGQDEKSSALFKFEVECVPKTKQKKE